MAGLVPGAHLGKGLGNQFLDDLRHADALIHVVDVSGTTDAEGVYGYNRSDRSRQSARTVLTPAGKETRGYDPSNDIRWLRHEIVRWIYGNLMNKWYDSTTSQNEVQD